MSNPEENSEAIQNAQGPNEEQAAEDLQAKKQDAEAREQGDIQGYKARVITEFDTGVNVSEDNPEMQVLFEALNPKEKIFPHTVVLHGRPGTGKTALARSIFLGWAKGKLYRDISYAFFFSAREIKWTEKSSLSQLISREWPDFQTVMTTIMSQPERLLFVIDGFDDLEAASLHDGMRLSEDWKDEQPIYVLMYSLLMKALLPQSFLMITTRDTALEKLQSMVVSPLYIAVTGLSAIRRTELALENISDDHRRKHVIHSVIDNYQLFDQCEVPSICSLIRESLQLQKNLEERLTPAYHTLTSLYATLVFRQLTLRRPSWNCLKQEDQAVLVGFCRMAAEGVWNMRSVFYDHDLQTHSLKQSEIAALFHMNILLEVEHRTGHYYIFFHRSMQDFCAALYYVLEKLPGKWNQYPSLTKDPNSIMMLMKKTDFNTHLLGMKRFLFGLMNKDIMTTLGGLLGRPMFPTVKQKLQHWISVLGQKMSATSPTDVLDALYLLFESQDEEFVHSALKSYQEMWLPVNHSMDLMVSSYCLQHCQNLKTLRVDVGDIFLLEKDTKQCPVLPQTTQCEPLVIRWWEKFCSALGTHRNLKQLDLGSSVLNEWAMKILCLKLRNSACSVQNLSFKNVEQIHGLQYLWMVLISNRNLRYLNLGNTLLRDDDIKLACEALSHPRCSLETLRMDSCQLTSTSYEMVSKLLLATRLKSLSLARNKVVEKNMRLICDSLSRPKCSLKRLILDSCELTPVSCQLLASALLRNPTLTHLCLSNNSLRAEEVRQLYQFTRHPKSGLERLILNQCSLRGDAYGFLALMLITSRKLTHLSLTMNPVSDGGMKLLCEAIKEPTCHLQELELVDCQLTGDCCEDLACVITMSKHLKSLDLGHNTLGDNGIIALCKGLKGSGSSLKRLGLEACGLTSDCCEALSSALSCNNHLTSINLIKNDFSTSGMLKLCSAFLHPTSNLWKIGLWKQQYCAQVRRKLEDVQSMKPHMIIDGDWYSIDEEDRNWWKN